MKRALLVQALVLALTLVGCGKLLGVDEYRIAPRNAPPTDAGKRGPSAVADAQVLTYQSTIFSFPFASSECVTCSDTSCAAEESDCKRDADCNAWARCRAACADAKCIAQCPRRVTRVAGVSGISGAPVPPAATAYGLCLNRNCQGACLAKNPGVDLALSPDAYECSVRACGNPLADSPDGSAALLACFSKPCGASVGPDWSCVGHVEWPTPSAFSLPVDFTVEAFDFTSGAKTIQGGTVSACDRAANECNPPLAGPGTTGSTGTYIFHLTSTATFAAGLFAYWEFSGATQYVPTLNWMTPPPVRAGLDARAQTSTAFLALTRSLGVDLVNHGSVGVHAQDCSGAAASGITLEVVEAAPHSPDEPKLTYIYSSGLQFVPGATTTDTSGLANAGNVKPGPIKVITRLGSTIISEQLAEVRAGWGTYFDLPPTPLTSN